jgi:predicted dehydrogenase
MSGAGTGTTRSVGDLRWGVLGAASIAPTVIAAIRAAGAGRVAALASRDPGRAWEQAARLGIPLAFGSYEALLASGEIDLLYVPLPNALHAEWTIRALEAGLPVLCEKPLTCDAAAARAVAAAAARAGRPVAEAFMYRFHPLYRRVLELVQGGRIGRLRSIWAQFTFHLDDRSESPASAILGGGALLDVGCYCVNLARLVSGAEPRRALAFERRSSVDDSFYGALEFPDRVVAQLECSIESHERHRAEIAGTLGSIVIERPWFPGRSAAQLRLRVGETEEVVETPGGDGYELEVLDFAAAVAAGTAPRWPLADAIANMAALDALRRAAASGRVETVEP